MVHHRSIRGAAPTSSPSTAATPGWSTTTCAPTSRTSTRSIAMLHSPDPRRRARLRVPDPGAGGLDRPSPAGGPVPRPPRVPLWRRRAHLGAVRRLRHERRHCRRENLAGCSARCTGGRRPDPRCLRAERQPITEQVSHFAMNTALAMSRARAEVPANRGPGPEGDAVRERIGRAMYELNVQQFCCGGLNFGYFYDRSPIIVYDGESRRRTRWRLLAIHCARLPDAACLAPRRTIAVRRARPWFSLLRFDRSVRWTR